MRLVLALLVAGCCGHGPKPVPVMAPTAACVIAEPPKREPVTFRECPGWVACLDTANALALEKNLKTADAYMSEAFLRCGK